MGCNRELTNWKMIQYRRVHGITLKEMARRCDTSTALLEGLESDNWITHPAIVARVCKEYELDLDDYNALVNPVHKATKLPQPKAKRRAGSWHGWDAVFRSTTSDDYNE